MRNMGDKEGLALNKLSLKVLTSDSKAASFFTAKWVYSETAKNGNSGHGVCGELQGTPENKGEKQILL